jgi:hypothetical protein
MAALVLLASTAAAQNAKTETVRLPDGRTIYVSGLRRWTIAMIQDSLAKYSPKDSLQSHACAAVLRYKLHFADAAAMNLMMGGSYPDVAFVDVREPQDSARVHYRDLPLDTISPKAEWRTATAAFEKNPRAFRAAAATHLGAQTLATNDTVAARVAGFFSAHRAEGDLRAALSALATSPNMYDRSTAAVLLANFPERPEVLPALLNGILESDGPVKDLSLTVLDRLLEKPSVKPDWMALAPQIHAILDGTSLFMLPDVLELLAKRPDIGPALARPFLAGGGEMILSYLEHPQPMRSGPARAVLTKLRGADLGSDSAAWRHWIDTLR